MKVMLAITRHEAAGLSFYGPFSPKHETSTISMFADGLVINFFDCIILCLEIMLGCEELLKSCSSAA